MQGEARPGEAWWENRATLRKPGLAFRREVRDLMELGSERERDKPGAAERLSLLPYTAGAGAADATPRLVSACHQLGDRCLCMLGDNLQTS